METKLKLSNKKIRFVNNKKEVVSISPSEIYDHLIKRGISREMIGEILGLNASFTRDLMEKAGLKRVKAKTDKPSKFMFVDEEMNHPQISQKEIEALKKQFIENAEKEDLQNEERQTEPEPFEETKIVPIGTIPDSAVKVRSSDKKVRVPAIVLKAENTEKKKKDEKPSKLELKKKAESEEIDQRIQARLDEELTRLTEIRKQSEFELAEIQKEKAAFGNFKTALSLLVEELSN